MCAKDINVRVLTIAESVADVLWKWIIIALG